MKILPDIEIKEGDSYKYPRLETLTNNCIRIIEGKDIIEEVPKGSAQPGKPGAKPGQPAPKKPVVPVNKKDTVKGKAGPGGKQVEEEVKEKSPMEKEMEAALELERQGSAFRIMLVSTYGMKILQGMRSKALDLYDKLNVWTEYGFKIECDLMDELVTAFDSVCDAWVIHRKRGEDPNTAHSHELRSHHEQTDPQLLHASPSNSARYRNQTGGQIPHIRHNKD